MELEEDLNLMILDEVKRTYFESFEYLKNGVIYSDQKQEKILDSYVAESRITFIFKFQDISPTPLEINIKNGSIRKIFQGKDMYCKNIINYNVIGKNLEIEQNMIKMLKLQQSYILHNVLVYQIKNESKNQTNSAQKKSKSSSNYINLEQDHQDSNVKQESQFYYVIDEQSQILEDESMDFISTLTRLSDHTSEDESVFQINYTQQLSQIQKPLNMSDMKMLSPKIISSFEGVITHIDQGRNLIQIDELIDQFNLNSRRDRFFKLTVRCAKNYLDQFEVYLIYDILDQDAQQQLQFYLHPFQSIKIFKSLHHFDNKLQPFIISFFYSPGINTNSTNFENFKISQRGIYFFGKDNIDKNQIQCQQMIKNYSKLSLSNISALLNNEMIMIRTHIKLNVKVKKIKYFQIRLKCFNCKQEWSKGFKYCIDCKETEQQISFGFQVLVQDQNYLEQQAYLYINDDKAIQFFNISEQEKKDIINYLVNNCTFMQLQYSVSKEYPISIIKFKDRIFTQDISRVIVGIPFADLSNKIFNSNQLTLHEERMRAENIQFFNTIMGDEQNQKFKHNNHRNAHKKQIFINGTYIASNFSQSQKITLKPIPCLKVVYVFPEENVISQAVKVIEEIQNLKLKINLLH